MSLNLSLPPPPHSWCQFFSVLKLLAHSTLMITWSSSTLSSKKKKLKLKKLFLSILIWSPSFSCFGLHLSLIGSGRQLVWWLISLHFLVLVLFVCFSFLSFFLPSQSETTTPVSFACPPLMSLGFFLCFCIRTCNQRMDRSGCISCRYVAICMISISHSLWPVQRTCLSLRILMFFNYLHSYLSSIIFSKASFGHQIVSLFIIMTNINHRTQIGLRV